MSDAAGEMVVHSLGVRGFKGERSVGELPGIDVLLGECLVAQCRSIDASVWIQADAILGFPDVLSKPAIMP